MEKIENKVKMKCPHCGEEFESPPKGNAFDSYALRKENEQMRSGDEYVVYIRVTEQDSHGLYTGDDMEYRITSSKPFTAEELTNIIFQICEIERIYEGKIYFDFTVLLNGKCIDQDEGEVEVAMKLTKNLTKFVNWEKCSKELPPIYEIDRQNSRVTRIE